MEYHRSNFHVHFTEENDSFTHDSNIIIKPNADGIVIHLGFLKIKHRYEISFSFNLPSSFGQLVAANNENYHVKLIEFNHQEKDELNIYSVKLEFFAYKAKLLKETMVFHYSNDSTSKFFMVLNARILGKGKGTPLLKSGIKCIGFEADEDESEMSDWQEFDNSYSMDNK